MTVRADDGREGTAIYEVTGARHHHFFPDTDVDRHAAGMTSGTAIADTPEALTPEWLTDALTDAGTWTAPGHRRRAEPVGTGQMCDSVRVTSATTGPPTRRHDDGQAARRPTPPAGRPPCRCAATRTRCASTSSWRRTCRSAPRACLPRRHRRRRRRRSSCCSRTWPRPSRATSSPAAPRRGRRLAVDELVRLHAPAGATRRCGSTGSTARPPTPGQLAATLLQMLWDGFRERYADGSPPRSTEAGDCVFGLERYIEHATVAPTVVHGDYRLDNLLFGGEAEPVAVVDWQTVSLGAGLSDVAYFFGAGLEPDDRRARARLVADYHGRLVAAGVEGYDWDRPAGGLPALPSPACSWPSGRRCSWSAPTAATTCSWPWPTATPATPSTSTPWSSWSQARDQGVSYGRRGPVPRRCDRPADRRIRASARRRRPCWPVGARPSWSPGGGANGSTPSWPRCRAQATWPSRPTSRRRGRREGYRGGGRSGRAHRRDRAQRGR